MSKRETDRSVVDLGSGGEATAAPAGGARGSDPRAQEYARSIAARRGAQLGRYTEPVAGGPAPRIPLLDGEAPPGMTMEQAARAEASRAGLSARAGQVTLPAGLHPSDLLPEAAKADPRFRSGPGSMIAASQPELAYRYGVIRHGQHVPPGALERAAAPGDTGRGRLRPETVAGLRALEEVAKDGASRESEPGSQAALGEARRPGAPSARDEAEAGGDKKLSSEEQKLVEELDDFDLEKFKSRVLRDLLNNEEQRRIVEERLEPLDLGRLIADGRVFQRVPVLPGRFEPEFQSYLGDEDLILKRLITEEASKVDVSDRYFLDKYSLMGLTVAVRSVNRTLLPDYLDERGEFDVERFWKKFRIVSKFGYHMLSSLAVHWFWFEMRVRKLFVAERVGNG
jgi:hypothetical protein